MRVLIACETSGRTRDEFRKRGHDAWSADLLPCDADPAYHIVCSHELEIFEIINRGWDLMIGHPDCTYLTCSGLHWNKRRPERAAKTEAAVEFFRRMLEEPGAARRVLENPRGCISTRIRKYDQEIQPYQFGDDASKTTCLWTVGNIPILAHTKFVPPRMVCKTCKGTSPYDAAFKRGCIHCGAEPGLLLPRWANQTDSGQNKLTPSEDRSKLRSITYPGIAAAMAEQWGNIST